MTKTSIALGLSLILSLYGCSSDDNHQQAQTPQKYSVISDTTKKNNAKRVVEIELPTEISQAEVEKIADSIKESTDSTVQNVFVTFRIKDSSSSGYWATVQYTPEKSVNIMGNTQNQAQNLEQQIKSYKPNGKLIGVWEFKYGMDCAFGLYEQDSKVFSNYICDSAIDASKPLKYIEVDNEQRIEDLEPKGHGEYMVINKDGDLEFRSPNKTYYTGKKLR